MAVTFPNLHTDSGLMALDDFLSGKSYISGDLFTEDDIKVYGSVLEKPGDKFANAATWYDVVSSHLSASFPGNAQGVRFSGKAAPAEKRFIQYYFGNAQGARFGGNAAPAEASPAKPMLFNGPLVHSGKRKLEFLEGNNRDTWSIDAASWRARYTGLVKETKETPFSCTYHDSTVEIPLPPKRLLRAHLAEAIERSSLV